MYIYHFEVCLCTHVQKDELWRLHYYVWVVRRVVGGGYLSQWLWEVYGMNFWCGSSFGSNCFDVYDVSVHVFIKN